MQLWAHLKAAGRQGEAWLGTQFSRFCPIWVA